MGKAIIFIETPMFTRQIKQIATDDELKELQKELIGTPDKGDLIQQTGGLRKVRMAAGSQGKSGSVRIIYFLATEEIIYLIMAYPINAKDSLTDTEKAQLKKLTKLLKARYKMSFFDELKTSLEEAVEIKQGLKEPARVTRYEIADVKAIREQLNVSQSEMAKALGTSVDTIKSWESKRRNPTGLAAKVLATIKENPAFFRELASH